MLVFLGLEVHYHQEVFPQKHIKKVLVNRQSFPTFVIDGWSQNSFLPTAHINCNCKKNNNNNNSR